VNSRLKKLVHRHRGLPQDRKSSVVSRIFGAMQREKTSTK
jgi:hypothetical protein